jgi:superfamily II DNA or RNA helicase
MLPGHFSASVRIESLQLIADGQYILQVRTASGLLDETVLTATELARALEDSEARPAGAIAKPDDLFLWVEHHRIRLAYAYDPYFAVSVSGVRGLPHQVEAVYRNMLPQPRLRFVLADDPGAGKTIMAGLLIKELKLRGAADRILVVAPAPLTIQWQDEMLNRFDELFKVISSHEVRWQLGGNPWQQNDRVITSLDFAKQLDVMPDLLRADWDLVIIDEAHKCSAATYGDEVKRTKRYVLAEELSRRATRLLLLTATPHSGDEDRFTHFLALLDPDQFATSDLVKRQIALPNSPYFLRRQKEDLKDEHNRKLFVERRVLTQPFTLAPAELQLYGQVTTYINAFLGAGHEGRGRANAIALARTVLQRRLASSLGAIRSSLQRRAERLNERADELERMTAAEQRKKLADLGHVPRYDEEEGDEDADEETQDAAAIGVSAAEHVGQLRVEIAELKRLAGDTDRVMALGDEKKLTALRSCLERAELVGIRDGRAKLLIFTEHRDTLTYLVKHLTDWGFSVCSIHGGNPPTERRLIQQDFHLNRQVCVATEAAGEGINLQFCHLMINYDLPWNPVRLEQRMGRIHRIGQESEVVVFNFCATNTVEGQLLERLTIKLETMKAALSGRVYDVIGDLLAVNGLDFERMLRDTVANPKRRDASLEKIEALSAEKLKRYEEDVGLAQATRHVDVSWVRRNDWQSEERRLMPEYIERFFIEAAGRVKLRVERRADGLYRAESVPRALRSDDLPSVKRLGPPLDSYRKLTFRKQDRERAEHEDAALVSPGHPLFAAVADALARDLEAAGVPGATAAFVDPGARTPYRVHFLTAEVVAERENGSTEPAYGQLVAVLEEAGGDLHLAAPDVLHDLTVAPTLTTQPFDGERARDVTNWVRAHVQATSTADERSRRMEQASLRSHYLEEAIAVQQRHLEDLWATYDQRVYKGEDSYRLLRDETKRKIDELERRRQAKLEGFRRLGVVRPGAVTYLGSASVFPPAEPNDPSIRMLRPDPEVELAAMRVAIAFETEQGWQPEDVSHHHDGSGFDVRSIRGDEVRRIEVKGRSDSTGDVGLYRTEWYAAQRFGQGYWLYVVYQAAGDKPRLVRIQDPAGRLRDVEEVSQVTGYRVPSRSIEELAE